VLVSLDECSKAIDPTDGHACHACHDPHLLSRADTMDKGVIAGEDLHDARQDRLKNVSRMSKKLNR
jgi:hypothetical protein